MVHRHIHHIRKSFSLSHPWVLVLVAQLIWGASAPITKLALRDLTPGTFLFLRMLIASILLLPLALRHRSHLTFHDQLFILLSAGFGMYLNILFFYQGIDLVPSIHAPIISSLGPLLLAFVARAFLHEKLSRRHYIGLVISFFGALTITVLPELFASSNVLGITTGRGSMLSGNALLFLGTVLGILGTICIRPIKHISAAQITFWQCAITATFSLHFALNEGVITQISHMGFYGVMGLMYAGVLSSVVAYTLYNQGLHFISASESGMLNYAGPIAAMLVAVPLLGEYPTGWFAAGSLCIGVGILIGEHRSKARS